MRLGVVIGGVLSVCFRSYATRNENRCNKMFVKCLVTTSRAFKLL